MTFRQPEREILEALEVATEDSVSTVKLFFYVVVTVIATLAFLLHIWIPHPHPAVKAAAEIRNENLDRLDELKDSIFQLAKNDRFIYLEHQKLLQEIAERESKKDELQRNYIIARDSVTIFGFYSPHKFIWYFGIGLLLSLYAIDMLYTLSYFNGNHRKARTWGVFCALTIAGYYMSWIFYPGDDLPTEVYLHVLLALGILSGVMGVFIAKTKRKTTTHLKLSFLKFLSDMINVDIKNIYKIAIAKDLEDDAYQKALKDSSVKLRKKTREKAEEIMDY